MLGRLKEIMESERERQRRREGREMERGGRAKKETGGGGRGEANMPDVKHVHIIISIKDDCDAK